MKDRPSKSWLLFTLAFQLLLIILTFFFEKLTISKIDYSSLLLKVQIGFMAFGLLIFMTQAEGIRSKLGVRVLLGSFIAFLVYLPFYFIFFFKLSSVC